MNTRNLSTVTTDLITSYGNSARNIINAYRVGNERVIGFMDQRWENALAKSGKQLSAEVRGNALSAQKKLSAYYVKSLGFTTNSADTVVGKVVELAGKGVRQVAANASRFEKSTGVTALHKLAVTVVPAAEAVGKLAGKIEQQTGRLASKVAGTKASATVVAARRVSPLKKARARKAA